MIERTILSQLIRWSKKADRKPLLLFGARQIGKTWILKYFGGHYFENYAYFSLDEDAAVADFFRQTKDPHRIIEQLSFLTPEGIFPGKTLIILDEIQECPEALSSLKYFCEKAPEYSIAAAGSLLGITLGHPSFSFPVGKVDHLDMYPVSFSEFLLARNKRLYEYYQTIGTISPIPQIFFDQLNEAFVAYRICGGMPEAVIEMLAGNKQGVEEKLSSIIRDYSLDFVKHATPALANKISYVWQSLPSQLAKENRKFIYQVVRPGARARDYEDALVWLRNAGVVYQVSQCKKPFLPLSAYKDLNIFKVYSSDIGLLRKLANMDAMLYVTPKDQFKEFKGALAENYVLQSLVMQYGKDFCFWSSGNQAEIEFLLQTGTSVYPVEVKSGTSVTGKSMSEYSKTYAPDIRLRFSMLNLKNDNGLLNFPLFLADRTKVLLERL